MEKAKYFYYPDDKKKKNPIEFYKNENHLNFALIEVGCKQAKKRAALRDKKELFYKYWAETYRKQGIDWVPQIFKILAHYDPLGKERKAFDKKVKADHIIYCKNIDQKTLESLTEYDYNHIFHTVSSLSKKRDVLEDLIIYNKDAQALQYLIVKEGHKPEYSNLRGKMAEILIQKAIENAKPEPMSIKRNGRIKYFTKKFPKYNEGTEIDAIADFHGTQQYIQLIENLKLNPNLIIKEDDYWKKEEKEAYKIKKYGKK